MVRAGERLPTDIDLATGRRGNHQQSAPEEQAPRPAAKTLGHLHTWGSPTTVSMTAGALERPAIERGIMGAIDTIIIDAPGGRLSLVFPSTGRKVANVPLATRETG